MSRICRIAAVLLAALLPVLLGVNALAAADAPAAVLAARESVLRIECYAEDGSGGWGTGFVVSNGEDGTCIATNEHVVEGRELFRVWLDAGDVREAEVVFADPSRDLALLRLYDPALSLKPLPLSVHASHGMAVYALGFPAAADYMSDTEALSSEEITITDGLVSALRSDRMTAFGPLVDLLQMNAAINGGNSGGPLLNSRGQVVGVNTFSILGSESIHGAVAVSELILLLEQKGIEYVSAQHRTLRRVLLTAVPAVLLAVGALLLLRWNKRRKNRARVSTLGERLGAIGRALTPQEAVSLLMPVLLAVRDENRAGRLLQRLSPETVCVRGQTAFIDDARIASGMLTLRYAAPEQKLHGVCTAATDIYALSAMLSEMTGDTADAAFAAVLRRGLSEDPADRFADVQQMIYALAPYNTGAKLPEGLSKQKRKRRFSRRTRALVAAGTAAGFAVLLVLGHCIATYSLAIRHLERGDMKHGAAYVDAMWLTALLEKQDWSYLSAAYQVQLGNYDRACSLLAEIPTHRNSAQLGNEVRYIEAASLAENENFDAAEAAYLALGEYKDSVRLVREVRYAKGVYLAEQKQFEQAQEIFAALYEENYAAALMAELETLQLWADHLEENGDYCGAFEKISLLCLVVDATDQLVELRDKIYRSAVDDYQSGAYADASEQFDFLHKCSPHYGRTDDYRLLLECMDKGFYAGRSENLYALIGFENANEVIVSSSALACDFLSGGWRGSGHTMTIEQEMDDVFFCTFDLPMTGSGDRFTLTDGWFCHEDKADAEMTKAFEIGVIGRNLIRIRCAGSDRVYVMNRR